MRPKIPVLKLNVGSISAKSEQYLKEHTFIQALLVHGSQLRHAEWQVTTRPDVLQNSRQLPFHKHDCRTAKIRKIMWHTTADFNTIYISF
jgi:hypothetical protein